MRAKASIRLLLLAAVAAATLLIGLPTSSALAGRLVVTGHDTDHNCGRERPGVEPRQCHFFNIATSYVRATAPDPNKPVLVLDRGALDVVRSLDLAFGPGVVPRTVISPRSAEFASAPINTNLYSAVIVASSKGFFGDSTPHDLNEEASTPDSDAINAREADFAAFFNSGGGLFVNSGGLAGDGDAGDPYYNFLPIGVVGRGVSPPFTLTPAGTAFGLTDADINCCRTENSFELPSPESLLKPAELDSVGRAETLIGEATSFRALAAEPTVSPSQVVGRLPSTRSCLNRRFVKIKLRTPTRVRYAKATVYVGRKRVRVLTRSRLTRTFSIRLLRSGPTRIKIVVLTTGGRKVTVKRTYRRCAS